MALALPDHWVWDHWVLTSDTHLDLFFLRASRALGEPHRRHLRASIGHARSVDQGKTWQLLPDALVHADRDAFDDRATWTGSAINHPNGFIRLFYTGVSWGDGGQLVQRIGWADSFDGGLTFQRTCPAPLEADGRWYETPQTSTSEIAWRDPFVFFEGGQWHMLITATLAPKTAEAGAGSGGPVPTQLAPGRGVVGHAVSSDLEKWEVCAPITINSQVGQMECSQSRTIGGKHYLVYSCDPQLNARGGPGTVWLTEGPTPLGPFDVSHARWVEPENLYASQLFQDTTGNWFYTGFDSLDEYGFNGVVPDPIPFEQLRLRD